MTNNAIAISTSRSLSNEILTLKERFEQEARLQVSEYLETDGRQFTQTEKYAMVKLQQLKMIKSLTLAKVILMGEVIQEIEAHGLWSAHPMGYQSMEEAAKDQGISLSEYSNIRDLTQIIFPYLQEAGYTIAEQWERIGISKFRELIPVLKRAITGTESRSERVEAVFNNEMDDIYATASVAGDDMNDIAARQLVVDTFIQRGELPVTELRRHLRPERTPSLMGWRVPYRGNQSIFMMVVNEDQEQMLSRRLNGYMDVTPVQRDEMSRSQVIREIGRYFTQGD